MNLAKEHEKVTMKLEEALPELCGQLTIEQLNKGIEEVQNFKSRSFSKFMKEILNAELSKKLLLSENKGA